MKSDSTLIWITIGIGIAVVLSAGIPLALSGWKLVANADRYLPLLNAAEAKYGIPKDLLARIAYQESRFRDDIVKGQTISSAGAVGIMQLVPKFHPGVNPLDVSAAINYAAQYLKNLYNQFGDWKLAAAAYNAGAGNVTKYGGIPPFNETIAYVRDIFNDIHV
jgi:soluble lytic murein transglycosylase-like protein